MDVSQLEEFSGVSPFLQHIAILKEYEQYANQIPNDIASAVYYTGGGPLLYLLLFKEDEYFYVIYDVKKNRIESTKEDALLDLLKCTKDTPTANVGADEVERLAQKARKVWERQNDFKSYEDVERICACYLIPNSMKVEFSDMVKGELR